MSSLRPRVQAECYAKETLLGATLDVVSNYIRQAEENPAKILEALQKAESTPTNGTYPEFTLKVCTSLESC